MKDRVFEFARDRERPEIASGSERIIYIRGRRMLRSAHEEARRGILAIEIDLDVRIANARIVDAARERLQHHAAMTRRTIRARCDFSRLACRGFEELRAWYDLIDEAPLHRALAAHAFLGGAKKIRAIAPHHSLVDQPCEASRPRQHREERKF